MPFPDKGSQSNALISRYDIGNGNIERGKKTLAIFRANGDVNHPDVIAETEEILAAVGELSCQLIRGIF